MTLGRMLSLASIGALGLVAFLWIGFGPRTALGLGVPAAALLAAGFLLKRALDATRILKGRLRNLVQTLSLHHRTLIQGPEPDPEDPAGIEADRQALLALLRARREELEGAVRAVPPPVVDALARYRRLPSRLDLEAALDELGRFIEAYRRSDRDESAEGLDRLLAILDQENLLAALRLGRSPLPPAEAEPPPLDFWGTG